MPIWSGIRYELRKNYSCVSICLLFQFQINKKESVIYMYEFKMDYFLEIVFFNLSNDDNFSSMHKCNVAFCTHLLVWKQVWILGPCLKMGVENEHFWFEIRSGFEGPGSRTPPWPRTKNSQEYPLPQDFTASSNDWKIYSYQFFGLSFLSFSIVNIRENGKNKMGEMCFLTTTFVIFKSSK